LTRRHRPAVEPLRIDDALLRRVAEPVVERAHACVVRPHHQLNFFDALLAQPILGCRHDGAAEILPLPRRIDRDVIDPTAVAVVSDHGGGDDRAIRAADQDGGVCAAPGERDVARRIVPRPRQPAALPQRDDGVDIGIRDGRNREAQFISSSQRTP